MKIKTFCCFSVLLTFSTAGLYAQPNLPGGGTDPDATNITCSISNVRQIKNIILINPGQPKNILHLIIAPAFAPGSDIGKTLAGTIYKIKIINNLGSIVQSAVTDKLNWRADISKISPGTYILQITDNRNDMVIGEVTFVKQHS